MNVRLLLLLAALAALGLVIALPLVGVAPSLAVPWEGIWVLTFSLHRSCHGTDGAPFTSNSRKGGAL